MKLLMTLLNISEQDLETIKDWFGLVFSGVSFICVLISPVLGVVVALLTIAVLIERWKYYRNKNQQK